MGAQLQQSMASESVTSPTKLKPLVIETKQSKQRRRWYGSLSTALATLVVLILSLSFAMTNLHYDRHLYQVLSSLEDARFEYSEVNLFFFQQAAFLEMQGLTNGTYPIPDWAYDNFELVPSYIEDLQEACEDFEDRYDATKKEVKLLRRAQDEVDEFMAS